VFLPVITSDHAVPCDGPGVKRAAMQTDDWNHRRKAFDNEWMLQALEDLPSFFTKRMFGGLAVYLFGRMMMVLMEPTKTGRWKWHGILICTDHPQHAAIMEDFPALAPHTVLKKWLYIDSHHDDFEPTMERIVRAMARDDQRFGIQPRPRKAARSRSRRRNRRANAR
jgi:hypothetical protein